MSSPNLVWISVPNSKLKAQVASDYAQQFQAFINTIAPYYQIKSLGGYANRANVNNPNVKSHHAHGWAIDINPATNPNIKNAGPLAQRMKNRSKYTDMPMWMSDIAKLYGIGWGANWKTISDAMHFSVASNEGGKKLARLPTDAEVAAVFKKYGIDWKSNGNGGSVIPSSDVAQATQNLVNSVQPTVGTGSSYHNLNALMQSTLPMIKGTQFSNNSMMTNPFSMSDIEGNIPEIARDDSHLKEVKIGLY